MGIDYNVKIHGVDKLVEGSWTKWSHKIKFSFMETGLNGYLNVPSRSHPGLKTDEMTCLLKNSPLFNWWQMHGHS